MSRSNKQRVMGWPAFKNQASNPYNALLYSALERHGVVVDDFSPRKLLTRHYEILHIHWPEAMFNRSSKSRSYGLALISFVLVCIAKLRGTKLVWTVHNLRPHERNHPILESFTFGWFIRAVDGIIALTPSGKQLALGRYPALANRPAFIIPHGHYREAYLKSMTRSEARATLGLPSDAKVILFLGSVRRYKNVEGLIEAFISARPPDWRLIIAGQAYDDEYMRRLIGASNGDQRVSTHFGFIADNDVQKYYLAADLVVIPYLDILNSGSAILALTFSCPVLVPSLGAMADLQQSIGPEWVMTFEGKLTRETLTKGLAWARHERYAKDPFNVDMSWDAIAMKTIGAYKCVMTDKHESR